MSFTPYVTPLRGRLRAVNCPADMIDQIGGWRKRSVGEAYGDGYELTRLCDWLTKALA